MAKKHSPAEGSKIAKSGFKNEDRVAKIFNDWKKNKQAKQWLKAMEFDLRKIKTLHADTSMNLGLGNIKSDVIVNIDGTKHGISVKLHTANFNQLQRGSVDNISQLLEMPAFIAISLKKLVGADGHQPADYMTDSRLKAIKKERKKNFTDNQFKTIERHKKLLISEFDEQTRKLIYNWFSKNRKTIVKILLTGKNDSIPPKWFLSVKHSKGKILKASIISMKKALDYYSQGEISFRKSGVFEICGITMQRKSGDGGRKSGQDLQFKIKPEDVFN